MISIIWAFCSMLVFFLIIAFLPLGLTLKGKISLVFASFLFALGGLAAVVSFPLWQTALMLVALIFFAAYFLEKRLGTTLFKNTPVFQEEWTEKFIIPLSNSKIDFNHDESSIELTELRQTEESQLVSLTPPVSSPLLEVNEQVVVPNNLLEEDISFLLERETENKVDVLHEEEQKVGYLSEIESLLDEELLEKEDVVKRDWLEDLNGLLPLDEVAATKTDIEEKKKVSLQK